jgi:glycosyltransferase involved in cell wall biosynthesis
LKLDKDVSCITFIVPVYNTETYLSKAIVSIQQLSLKNIQIIIVDDASQGNCELVVKELHQNDSRITYVKHEKNLGLFQARLTGILHAKGEYIAHLDSDDWLVNDIYTKAYLMATKDKLDLVLFDVLQTDELGYSWIEERNKLSDIQQKTGKALLNKILESKSTAWIWHIGCNKLIKRDVLLPILDKLKSVKHLNMYEDLLWSVSLYLKLYSSEKIGILPQIGLIYYRHSQSITKDINYKTFIKKYKDLLYSIDRIFYIFEKYGLYKKHEKELHLLKCYLLSTFSFKNQDLKKALFFKYAVIFILYFFEKLKFSCKNMNSIEDSVKKIRNKILESNIEQIVIFGTGKFAIDLMKLVKQDKIVTICFISSDITLVGKTLQNVKVCDIEDGIKNANNKIICIASIGSYEKIKVMLGLYDLENVKIIHL